MQYIFLLLTYQNQIINSIALSLSYSLVPLQQKERELFSHKLEPHSSEPKEKQMNALLFWWLKFKNTNITKNKEGEADFLLIYEQQMQHT